MLRAPMRVGTKQLGIDPDEVAAPTFEAIWIFPHFHMLAAQPGQAAAIVARHAPGASAHGTGPQVVPVGPPAVGPS